MFSAWVRILVFFVLWILVWSEKDGVCVVCVASSAGAVTASVAPGSTRWMLRIRRSHGEQK